MIATTKTADVIWIIPGQEVIKSGPVAPEMAEFFHGALLTWGYTTAMRRTLWTGTEYRVMRPPE